MFVTVVLYFDFDFNFDFGFCFNFCFANKWAPGTISIRSTSAHAA